ncbi:GNAT family N-acetyltransferase [Streptomyces noursei]|uniref:Ribosomal-protein-alanine acetyltransferase n=1 Tax=Streptomyces noursei TaxID=1971 RepID=A0A2N8P6W8_STRNR|nr:GNAT family N-acetyltransferase [Streptomyces noursei]PNE36775.1 ribosomal-protein-alanine acetyltransferase [Streptomyces noursei]
MRWWDLDPVLELERDLFPEDAWSPGMFWSELAHARGPLATRRYLVAEVAGPPGWGSPRTESGGGAVEGIGVSPAQAESSARGSSGDRRAGRIVGYGGLAAIDGTGDVQTIATARDQWGSGLGARLLSALLATATDFECHEVLLEVRVDNARAQRLYERFGFEPIGFRRGYYQPGNVDALVMRRPSQTSSEAPSVQGT